MTKILAVGSPKGGVAKTTEAVHLAAIAARDLRLTTLLVDADVNHSTLQWADRSDETSMPLDVTTATGEEAADLAHLRRGRHYDLTVVDLAGAREGGFSTMLRGAGNRPVPDLLLMPTRPRAMDLRPVVRVLRAEVIPLGLPYLVVFTLVRTASFPAARQRQDELRNQGIEVADTIIRDYEIYNEAHETDRTVLDMPGAHSYARIAEAEQRALAREALKPLGFNTRRLTTLLGDTDGPQNRAR
ncbi:MAG: AAA family ATPase [Propionibacteriales bacterium]|nr:AAA family ATPase [Propionibacteriales bacterium]MPZ67454.1 AAA family ATPase [Pseudonocardiaceae bacterium]